MLKTWRLEIGDKFKFVDRKKLFIIKFILKSLLILQLSFYRFSERKTSNHYRWKVILLIRLNVNLHVSWDGCLCKNPMENYLKNTTNEKIDTKKSLKRFKSKMKKRMEKAEKWKKSKNENQTKCCLSRSTFLSL